jgi:hypothetical protein
LKSFGGVIVSDFPKKSAQIPLCFEDASLINSSTDVHVGNVVPLDFGRRALRARIAIAIDEREILKEVLLEAHKLKW